MEHVGVNFYSRNLMALNFRIWTSKILLISSIKEFFFREIMHEKKWLLWCMVLSLSWKRFEVSVCNGLVVLVQ